MTKEFGEKMILQTWIMQFTCPKKCTFWSTFGHKTLSYQEKIKTLFQMTYTIRMVRLWQFIDPGLGVSTYLDFGARLFQRSGHQMVPIYL